LGISSLRSVRYGLELVLAKGLALITGAVPRPCALAAGAMLGRIAWWSRIRRSLVLGNLAIAFPELSDPERGAIAAAAARNFGRTLVEFVRFAGKDGRRVGELVEVEGLDAVHEALRSGRGALCVTAHLGSWALYVAAAAKAGIPSALLVGVQRNPRVDAMIRGIPGDAMELIAKGRYSPRKILEALRANKMVVMVADHYSSEQTLFVPFLGRKAFTLPLPGALVARYRPPLFSLTGHRVGLGRHQVTLDPIELPPEGETDSIRVEVAQRCNDRLGSAIRRYPDQYFWYHDRWKVRRRGGPFEVASSPQEGGLEAGV
jgi:KDO2-lipid IV(A) lauroyltransferase